MKRINTFVQIILLHQHDLPPAHIVLLEKQNLSEDNGAARL